jgi:hypothetical protein
MREMLDSLQKEVRNHYGGAYRTIWVHWARHSKSRGEYSLLVTVFPNEANGSYTIIKGDIMTNPTKECAFNCALSLIDGAFV